MSLLDWLPGLEIAHTTQRRRGQRRTVRTFRVTAGPERARRQQGAGLLWRFGARLVKYMGGRPKCPQCGQPIESDQDVLCPRCGLPVYPLLHPQARGTWQPRECPDCGRELLPDDRYCPRCQVRTRVKRATAATERRLRKQRNAALHMERARSLAEIAAAMGLDPWLPGDARPVKHSRPKPVKVAAYTKEDGRTVDAHTRAKPGEGGAQP